MQWNQAIFKPAASGLILFLLPFLVSAQEILVNDGSQWRFLDDGSDQSVIWPLEVINDNSWSSGQAPLGYGNNAIVTTVGFGGNAQQKHITTYFRHSFNISDSSVYDSLTLRLRRDDGAIVYLNGSEIMRSNLSSCGDVDFQTTAANAIDGAAENTFIEKTVPSSLLMDGANLIAVEIHQVSAADSDLIFDLELIGNGVTNNPPSVTLTAPGQNAVFNVGDTITCEASASDDSGIDRVEFFADGNLIASDTTLPYSTDWSNASSGNHALTAVAYDLNGVQTTSATVNISVNAVNQAPTVSLNSPLDNTHFIVGDVITIEASANDNDDGIERVMFYANGNLITEDTTGNPYSATWSNASAGDYELSAIARDNSGAETTSSIVNIIVDPAVNQAPTVTLTNPGNGALFSEGTQITLSATAEDTDGNIVRVAFFVDNNLLTEDTVAPYSAIWQATGLGNHMLTAIAYDNSGASTSTEAVTVSVAGPAESSIFQDHFE